MFYFLRDVPDGGELVFPLADSEVRRGVLRALCACPHMALASRHPTLACAPCEYPIISPWVPREYPISTLLAPVSTP